MASQNPASDTAIYEVHSFVRGLHAYKDIWTPVVGEILRLRREPDNIRDRHAVAVMDASDRIVGHIPWNLAPIFSPFLLRDFNKGFVEVTGHEVNRGAQDN